MRFTCAPPTPHLLLLLCRVSGYRRKASQPHCATWHTSSCCLSGSASTMGLQPLSRVGRSMARPCAHHLEHAFHALFGTIWHANSQALTPIYKMQSHEESKAGSKSGSLPVTGSALVSLSMPHCLTMTWVLVLCLPRQLLVQAPGWRLAFCRLDQGMADVQVTGEGHRVLGSLLHALLR